MAIFPLSLFYFPLFVRSPGGRPGALRFGVRARSPRLRAGVDVEGSPAHARARSGSGKAGGSGVGTCCARRVPAGNFSALSGTGMVAWSVPPVPRGCGGHAAPFPRGWIQGFHSGITREWAQARRIASRGILGTNASVRVLQLNAVCAKDLAAPGSQVAHFLLSRSLLSSRDFCKGSDAGTPRRKFWRKGLEVLPLELALQLDLKGKGLAGFFFF